MHNKMLPNVYHFIDNLKIESILNHKKDICIIYRNYNCKINVEKLLNFKKFCKKSRLKFLIANEIDLAFRLKLDGVYLPSFNKKFNHKQFKSFKGFHLNNFLAFEEFPFRLSTSAGLKYSFFISIIT